MKKKMNDLIILSLAIISLMMMLFILTNCTIAPGSSGTSGPAPVYGHTNRVAVIGDSISAGINSDYFLQGKTNATYGWVDMLNGEGYTGIPAPDPNIHAIWPDTLVILNNYAGSGLTAVYWNNSSVLAPVISFNPDIIIVFIGANDVLNSVRDKSHPGIIPDSDMIALTNNIGGILDKLTNSLTNARLALIDYYDFLDGRSRDLTNSSTLSMFNYFSNMSEYTTNGNLMMSNLALGYGAKFIDIYPGFLNHCYGSLLGGSHSLPDFVNFGLYTFTNYIDPHPTTAGHGNIFVTVLNVIKYMTN